MKASCMTREACLALIRDDAQVVQTHARYVLIPEACSSM